MESRWLLLQSLLGKEGRGGVISTQQQLLLLLLFSQVSVVVVPWIMVCELFPPCPHWENWALPPLPLLLLLRRLPSLDETLLYSVVLAAAVHPRWRVSERF